MTAAPKAVIFDIGNVLVNWDPMKVYARLIPDAAERAALFARVDFDAMNLDGDRNGDLAAEVAALAARHPEDSAMIRVWRAEWDRMLGPEHTGTSELLRRLKSMGVPVHALSNFAADTYLEAQALHPVLTEFDIEIISGRESAIKPEPRIYELLEERSGLSGADLFFTDDKPENIDAAAARGWRTHLFEAPDGLAAALRAEGFAL